MKPSFLLTFFLSLLLTTGITNPVLAANPPQPGAAAKAQLLYELGEVQKMTLALAEALPPDAYNWRPKENMRSAGEMLLHTARGNFSQPESWGVTPPEELVLCGNYLDQGNLEKPKVIDMLKKSFEHARKAIGTAPEGDLFKTTKVDNRQTTAFEDILALVTRGYENLGRMISYSMMKGITPPWMGGWYSSGS